MGLGRLAGIALILSLAALAAAALRLRDRAGLRKGNPRHWRDLPAREEPAEPRLLRFLDASNTPAWGLVVAMRDGYPQAALPLALALPGLAGSFDALLDRDGFSAAERLHLAWSAGQIPASQLVAWERSALADRVLPPLDTTIEQLESGQRAVLGVGLNYDDHAEDAGAEADEDGFLFAKLAAPTSAYAAVPLGPARRAGLPFAELVDYEVELAFVLLDEVALDALPDADTLAGRIAWMQANDVSDRWPILEQGDAGFTLAKSRFGYLPLGPWMVHGRHLDPRTAQGGRDEVELSLRVEEAEPHAAGSFRQHASSREMVRGPRAILELAARVWRQSARCDAAGVSRGIVTLVGGRPALPRGTLVLTGTPGGTAIAAPQGLDKVRLLLLGDLSVTRARLAYAEHCIQHRREMGFLSPGDVVDATIGRLGRQRWEVRR